VIRNHGSLKPRVMATRVATRRNWSLCYRCPSKHQGLISSRVEARKLKSANTVSPLSSCLLSKNTKFKANEPVILPVVLCGCETWSLTLREEHRLRLFEKSLLRWIFRPKRKEGTGGLRTLNINYTLHQLLLG
jgi:hypothetical protein